MQGSRVQMHLSNGMTGCPHTFSSFDYLPLFSLFILVCLFHYVLWVPCIALRSRPCVCPRSCHELLQCVGRCLDLTLTLPVGFLRLLVL
ncbi:hypothetical protein CRENBAI_024905 [Crenichthys baileyi]|uniref:Uncharacterized protein n=1 Tax=Crenichthys baileyi TaxID=28760 RepID=A0AAV9QVK8_9TELE